MRGSEPLGQASAIPKCFRNLTEPLSDCSNTLNLHRKKSDVIVELSGFFPLDGPGNTIIEPGWRIVHSMGGAV